MRHTRLLVSILSIALAALSVGGAEAWYSDSAAIHYQISAASDFVGEPDEKVWVCKLIGPTHDPKVKEGKNPIHVSIHSVHAEAGFSDAHPSYIVEHGGVECVVPDPMPAEERNSEQEPSESVRGETEEDTESSTTSTTTTTSTTSTSTSTSTTLPTPDLEQGTSTSTSTSTSSTTTTTIGTNTTDG